MLINLSNHPESTWDLKQKQIAIDKYGEIKDFPFPDVDPMADELAVNYLAKNTAKQCVEFFEGCTEMYTQAVHVMGEMTLTFAIVCELQKRNLKCVASTSSRKVQKVQNGWKNSNFKFCRFREYTCMI
jgi:hypothetical protein